MAELHTADLFEAGVSTVADDDVIEHVNTEELPRLNKTLRQRVVIGARRRITARVIVRQDDRRSVREKGCLEHFARLCCGRSYVG